MLNVNNHIKNLFIAKIQSFMPIAYLMIKKYVRLPVKIL